MGEEDADRPSLGTALGRFALALLAIAVIGLVAGIAYGRGTPERAAGTLLEDLVVVEDFRGDDREPAGTDDPAPTSGDHVGDPVCGAADETLDADTQLASLAAGRVIVQYDPEAVQGSELDRLAAWHQAYADRAVLAPNPRIDTPVVATAWTRRLPLRGAETSFLSTFVTAYVGAGPRPAPCDGGDGDGE